MGDSGNGRVIKWTTNYATGGVCVVGCTGTLGVAANQFNNVRDLRFDKYGNLYVNDQLNHRIQKFTIQTPFTACPSSKHIVRMQMLCSNIAMNYTIISHCIFFLLAG